MLRTGEAALVDIDANTVTTRELQPLELSGSAVANNLGAPAVVRGDRLVFHASERAWSAVLSDQAPPRELAPALLVLAAVDPRDVWLVVAADGRAAVQRWRADGSFSAEPVPLPVDWAPVAELDAGLLLRRGSRWLVWDPATGATVRESEPDARPVAGHGRMVAWVGPCEVPLCSLHVTDVVTGEDRTVFLGVAQIDWGLGAFSPDGRHLAAPAFRTPTRETWEPGFLVVDVAAGTAQFEAVSPRNGGSGQVTWSADSRWLFVLEASGAPDGDVRAYSPDERRTIDLRLPNRGSGYAMVAY
jgi:hypothetical protein